MPITRRTVLTSSLVAAVPGFLRARDRQAVRVGIMGLSRGTSLAKSFAAVPDTIVAAVCDADSKRTADCLASLQKAKVPAPKAVKDFRELLDDQSIDVFICAAPNFWHAPASILACQAGKHVYVEKPCSHTPHEGERLVTAARKHNRTVQMGTQRRSHPKFIEAIGELRKGVIGNVYFGQGWYQNNRPSIGRGQAVAVPAHLDFDAWQGPVTRRPYVSNLVHYNWHWRWHWGNGELGNNGVHYIDILRWGLGVTYPERVTSSGGRYKFDDDQETPDTHVVNFEFPGKKMITWEGFSRNQLPHHKPVEMLFHGESGTMTLDGGGYTIYDNKAREVKKATGTASDVTHAANMIDCVRGTAKPNAEIAEGATSTLLCHLGNIAHRVGRPLSCDPATGRIRNDADASSHWTKEYAKGWAEVMA